MSGADRELVLRLGKFLVVGSTGVVINNALLYTLYQSLRLPLILASILAVALSIINNFVWNDHWTFHGPHSLACSPLRRFIRFGLVSFVGLVLTTSTLWALVTYLQLHFLVANLIAIAAGTASNFLLNSRWTYGQSSIP